MPVPTPHSPGLPAAAGRKRIAIAMEYPLMQQGGTEVLVCELLRGLSSRYEIVLVSGDRDRDQIPAEFQGLICHHLAWDKERASGETARVLAEALERQNVDLAHFHFGGTY